jgi:hypothetical protein
LGKTALILTNVSDGRSSFQQAHGLAKARGDKFGISEAAYLMELSRLVESKVNHQPLSTAGLEEQVGLLRTNQLTNLVLSATYIRDGLFNLERSPELVAGTYHPGFTTNLLGVL